MFFSIITSVLTASEELRVNFPSSKSSGASDSTADSSEGMREEGQDKPEDPDARINVDDIESGRVDKDDETIHEDESSKTTISSLQESENVDEEGSVQTAEENRDFSASNSEIRKIK